MHERVVGLDVSKDNVSVCLLTEFPEPRQFYRSGEFQRLYTNAEGLKALLDLKPDVAVLEPTGVNYSKFWVTKLAEQGVKIALVGHRQLSAYRTTLDIQEKDDDVDALALACYYLQHRGKPSRFVRVRDDAVSQIRDLVLRLQHLNRIQSPIINRIKQDLAWAFPERCKTSTNTPLFWRWLAGEAKSSKYDAELQNSVGLGLNDHIRWASKQLVEIHKREQVIELEMRSLLSDARFLPYRTVFKRYGFGERTEALLLSQIYPLENYLEDGKPIVEITRGRVTKIAGKKTVKHISARKFQKALGSCPEREWSGDGKKSKKSGSRLCRTALWQWIFTRMEVRRSRLHNERFQELAQEFDRLRAGGMDVREVRGKIAGKAVRRLFYDLVNELQKQTPT